MCLQSGQWSTLVTNTRDYSILYDYSTHTGITYLKFYYIYIIEVVFLSTVVLLFGIAPEYVYSYVCITNLYIFLLKIYPVYINLKKKFIDVVLFYVKHNWRSFFLILIKYFYFFF